MSSFTKKVKNRLSGVSFFMKSVFIPAKGSDSLSLHQKTVTISIWIIVILTLFALLIEGLSSDNHWLTLVENLMIGIVCSAFVVVVTVFLQFKAEQENRIKEHNSAVYKLLSCIKVCMFEIGPPYSKEEYQREQYLLDSLYEERDRYLDNGLGLRWYSSRKMHEYYDVLTKVLPLIIPLMKRYPILCLEDYRETITPQMYDDAVDAAIVFNADYASSEIGNRFEALKHEQAKSAQGDIS